MSKEERECLDNSPGDNNNDLFNQDEQEEQKEIKKRKASGIIDFQNILSEDEGNNNNNFVHILGNDEEEEDNFSATNDEKTTIMSNSTLMQFHNTKKKNNENEFNKDPNLDSIEQSKTSPFITDHLDMDDSHPTVLWCSPLVSYPSNNSISDSLSKEKSSQSGGKYFGITNTKAEMKVETDDALPLSTLYPNCMTQNTKIQKSLQQLQTNRSNRKNQESFTQFSQIGSDAKHFKEKYGEGIEEDDRWSLTHDAGTTNINIHKSNSSKKVIVNRGISQEDKKNQDDVCRSSNDESSSNKRYRGISNFDVGLNISTKKMISASKGSSMNCDVDGKYRVTIPPKKTFIPNYHNKTFIPTTIAGKSSPQMSDRKADQVLTERDEVEIEVEEQTNNSHNNNNTSTLMPKRGHKRKGDRLEESLKRMKEEGNDKKGESHNQTKKDQGNNFGQEKGEREEEDDAINDDFSQSSDDVEGKPSRKQPFLHRRMANNNLHHLHSTALYNDHTDEEEGGERDNHGFRKDTWGPTFGINNLRKKALTKATTNGQDLGDEKGPSSSNLKSSTSSLLTSQPFVSSSSQNINHNRECNDHKSHHHTNNRLFTTKTITPSFGTNSCHKQWNSPLSRSLITQSQEIASSPSIGSTTPGFHNNNGIGKGLFGIGMTSHESQETYGERYRSMSPVRRQNQEPGKNSYPPVGSPSSSLLAPLSLWSLTGGPPSFGSTQSKYKRSISSPSKNIMKNHSSSNLQMGLYSINRREEHSESMKSTTTMDGIAHITYSKGSLSTNNGTTTTTTSSSSNNNNNNNKNNSNNNINNTSNSQDDNTNTDDKYETQNTFRNTEQDGPLKGLGKVSGDFISSSNKLSKKRKRMLTSSLAQNSGKFMTPFSDSRQTSIMKDSKPLIGGGLSGMPTSSSSSLSRTRNSASFGLSLSSTNQFGQKCGNPSIEDDVAYPPSNLQLSHLEQLATQQKNNADLLKRKFADLQDVSEEDEQTVKKLRIMLHNKLLHTPTKVHGVNE